MKLIIENRTDLNDFEVLNYVKSVIKKGKISETSKGKQYCFSTTFKDTNICVSCLKNKCSHRFIVHNYRKNDRK